MPPITPIHPVQAKDGRSYRRLAPAVQELMGGKGPSRRRLPIVARGSTPCDGANLR
jgi:hypothetical protein